MGDEGPRRDDRFARESFSFRRMRGWQSRGLVAVLVLIALAILIYLIV